MKNLIIGNTSQLYHYFPKENYDSISSRHIDYSELKKNIYGTIYILFAEQRTFLNKDEKFFIDINVNKTLEVINNLYDNCNRIVIYSTSELWNKYDGPISLDLPYDYNYTPYIKSKEILNNNIFENYEKYSKVKIIYPFNFNSVYRKSGFLFGKIFSSIINKTKESIGDVNFNRDLIHPSVIVNESINAYDHKIIGGGELVNVKNFIYDIYKLSDLNIDDYLTFDCDNLPMNKRNEYYSNLHYSNYNELLDLTLIDIKKLKK